MITWYFMHKQWREISSNLINLRIKSCNKIMPTFLITKAVGKITILILLKWVINDFRFELKILVFFDKI